MNFPEIGPAPEIEISKKKLDEFSSNRSSSWPENLKFQKNGWLFQDSVGVATMKTEILENFSRICQWGQNLTHRVSVDVGKNRPLVATS